MSEIKVMASDDAPILILREVDWLYAWILSNAPTLPTLSDVDEYSPTVYGNDDVGDLMLELERILFARPRHHDKAQILKLLTVLRTRRDVKHIIFDPLA